MSYCFPNARRDTDSVAAGIAQTRPTRRFALRLGARRWTSVQHLVKFLKAFARAFSRLDTRRLCTSVEKVKVETRVPSAVVRSEKVGSSRDSLHVSLRCLLVQSRARRPFN